MDKHLTTQVVKPEFECAEPMQSEIWYPESVITVPICLDKRISGSWLTPNLPCKDNQETLS